MSASLKQTVALVITIAALCFWGYRFACPSGPSEASLRNTSGLSASVAGLQSVDRGFHVHCLIENRSSRAAEQVVLKVSLVDPLDRVLAVNPLASAPAMSPGETRELTVFIPASIPATQIRATAEVSLVRWKE